MIETFNNIASEPIASWGGSWTEDKLDTFEKYVNAYLTIMNAYRDKYNWKLVYFDGFAGSGSRINDDGEDDSKELMLELFNQNLVNEDDFAVYKGAAERVLEIKQRGFDYYFFIEKDKTSSQHLKVKLNRFKDQKQFDVRSEDANVEVNKMTSFLCNNQQYKALVLLDPFGMQVEWDSIKKMKGANIDLWILIPTGVIVNRLLDRKGTLSHIDKLTSFYGMDEEAIRNYFYKKRIEQSLFGENTIIEKVKEPIKKIAELYIQQLRNIFEYVTPEPLVLYNSRNTPIFHFAFASNNETAKNIAAQIIKKKQ
ncbi:MAG: three-Cys-motif partner protein TcmP [Alphaproteobacteria bacterium]|nr:three-Cys-motif partner protein TcmP [Alphaproteobacteria bacterium]